MKKTAAAINNIIPINQSAVAVAAAADENQDPLSLLDIIPDVEVDVQKLEEREVVKMEKEKLAAETAEKRRKVAEEGAAKIWKIRQDIKILEGFKKRGLLSPADHRKLKVLKGAEEAFVNQLDSELKAHFDFCIRLVQLIEERGKKNFDNLSEHIAWAVEKGRYAEVSREEARQARNPIRYKGRYYTSTVPHQKKDGAQKKFEFELFGLFRDMCEAQDKAKSAPKTAKDLLQVEASEDLTGIYGAKFGTYRIVLDEKKDGEKVIAKAGIGLISVGREGNQVVIRPVDGCGSLAWLSTEKNLLPLSAFSRKEIPAEYTGERAESARRILGALKVGFGAYYSRKKK